MTGFAPALAHYRAGRLDEAEKACSASPRDADCWNLLGLIAARRGQSGAAVHAYRRAIELKPGLASAHANLGNAQLAAGEKAAAEASFRHALVLKPDLAAAQVILGSLLQETGRTEAAIECYRQAVRVQPGLPEAWNNMGNALRELGRLKEAADCHRKTIEILPDCAEAHNNLGNELQELGQPEDAVACLQRAIELKADFPAAHYNLGNAWQARGNPGRACACYRRAIELQPDYPEALTNLGNALHASGDLMAAADCHRRAIRLRPFYVEAINNLGNALRELGDLDAAVQCHREAIALQPGFAAAHSNLGSELEEQGRFDEARDAHARAVCLAPRQGSFYHRLAAMGAVAADSELVPRMQALVEDQGVRDLDRLELHFALSQVRGMAPANSFRHLLEANRLQRSRIDYDEAATMAMFDRIAHVFSAERLQGARTLGADSAVPVFVVGMPRSGTTLVEQVLASNRLVFGAGELAELPRLLGVLESNAGAKLPEALDGMPADAMRQLGEAYVGAVQARAPEAARIVDKLPGNFLRVGFIAMALPNARIVHVMRDPVDTCLSCFSKLFSGQLPYAYDLAELGRYYRAYAALMAHWRHCLPASVMLEVRYEDLVSDLPRQTRRMLDHCGLAWDPACLAFHQNRRAVQTYSATQVRQPLYASSVGRWHDFTVWARPLLQALDPNAA